MDCTEQIKRYHSALTTLRTERPYEFFYPYFSLILSNVDELEWIDDDWDLKINANRIQDVLNNLENYEPKSDVYTYDYVCMLSFFHNHCGSEFMRIVSNDMDWLELSIEDCKREIDDKHWREIDDRVWDCIRELNIQTLHYAAQTFKYLIERRLEA
jgi:hypothetical protein